jgi:preprotein translocase subunit SecB
MTDKSVSSAEAKQKSPAVIAYDAVVSGAELQDIKMVGLKFQINPKFFADIGTDERGEPNVTPSFGATFATASYDPDDGYLGGQINWSATVKKGRSKAVSIEAVYFIIYAGVPEVEEEHALAFLRRVGRFATYPYFRALVSRLSSESGLNLPILPVLK